MIIILKRKSSTENDTLREEIAKIQQDRDRILKTTNTNGAIKDKIIDDLKVRVKMLEGENERLKKNLTLKSS